MDEKRLIAILDNFQQKLDHRLNARLENFSQRMAIMEKQVNEINREVTAAHRRIDNTPATSNNNNNQIVAINKQMAQFARDVKKEINKEVSKEVKKEVTPIMDYAKYKLEDGEETLHAYRVKGNLGSRPAICGPTGNKSANASRLYYQDNEF